MDIWIGTTETAEVGIDQFLAIHVGPSIFPLKIIQLFQLIHVRILTDYLLKFMIQ